MPSTKLTIIAFLAAAWCLTSEGLYHDVACVGENNIPKCPDRHLIQLTAVHHGEKTDTTCSDRRRPAIVRPKNYVPPVEDSCLFPEILAWSQSVCRGLNRCRLPKPDKRMFACNFTENTFIQFDYKCNMEPKGMRKAVVCEGHNAEMKCETGTMKILSAKYGRFDEKICLDPHPDTNKETKLSSVMTFCGSYRANREVTKRCQDKKECKFKVSKENLGKPFPCDEHHKYLSVAYTCQ